MPKRANPEREQQVAVLRWLRIVLPKGSLVFAVKNENFGRSEDPMARARFQMARRAEGVLPGVPDLCALLPGGRVVFVEMKAPTGGVLSLDQQDIHRALRAIGHHVGVATDIETARGVMLAAGVALNESEHEPVRVAKVRAAPDPRLPSDAIPF